MSRTVTFLALLLPTAACFSPVYNDPQCSPSGECPDGLTCVNDVCVSEDSDGSVDADVPTGCYLEAADLTNDNGAEVTELAINPTDHVEICGDFAQRPPDPDGFIDVDRYQIQNPDGGRVIVRIVSPESTVYEAAVLQIIAGFQGPNTLLSEGYGALAQTIVPTSTTIEIAVGAVNNAGEIAQTVPYRIYVDPIDFASACDAPGTTNAEQLDAATGNIGNDVYTLDFQQGIYDFTPDPSDAPEDFATVVADTSSLLQGTVPNIDTHADSYRDRDTYRIRTGAGTNELTLVLTWPWDGTQPDYADIDFLVYPDGETIPRFTGYTVGATAPEAATINVLPNTMYNVVVANYLDAMAADKPYDLIVCGGEFVP